MIDRCFMVRTNRDGGGNILPPEKKVIRRSAAIGDAIAATIVSDKLRELGFEITFQTWGPIQTVLRHNPGIQRLENPGGLVNVNLDGVYEKHPEKRQRHFYGMFMDAARSQLRAQGIELGPSINCRPRLNVRPVAQESCRNRLSQYAKPWVFLCPRSENYKVRQVPDGIWSAAAKQIKGTCFWIGLHPAPEGIVDLQVRNLQNLIDLISVADLMVSVDTGPMHIANALGVQVLAICQSSSPELHLSDQSDFVTISPPLPCLNCMENVCPINQWKPPCQTLDPDFLAQWANRQLRATASEEVSAVIPIFRPSSTMLNRCLEAVLPQVSQVVITKERGGELPYGVISDPKISVVTKHADRIGFGRNVNFGVRHSSGKYVLILNDDVYLAPDAVSRMMDNMKPGVGIVGQLLYYPDGRIYHAGKPRQPGNGIGFPHIDLRKREHTIRIPVEMENTNGASILFRRKAFYDAEGYDEGYQFYAEDDDICMKTRRAGWRLWYTPLATGIHDEHQETRKVQGINSIMAQSNSRFAMKWGQYFRHNANNPGIGDFNY